MSRQSLRNEHGVILDWLLKIGIWLAIISVIVFDAGAILVNTVTLSSTATDLAIQVATTAGQGQAETDEKLKEVAELAAQEAGVRFVRVSIDEEGILHIRVRRTADTLIVSRIGAIEDWAVATADGQSSVR